MANHSHCEIVLWSSQATNTLQPIFYICVFAALNHLLFWTQFLVYPSVRQRSMQWLYAYLITDVLLLSRFFLLYAYRWSGACVPHLLRTLICYCEAIFDNYLNVLQSYILLALNVCRYLQIAHQHNVYSSNGSAIIAAHVLIYVLPLVSHVVAIVFGWSVLQSPAGDACDLLARSFVVRATFLLFSYFVPVALALTFLLLSLNFIRNTDGIRSQEIVDARLKHHRQLVVQSCVFYSLWLLLWSPHVLVFPFCYKSSGVGNVAQMLSYVSIALNPIVIAALDVRFLQAWKSTRDRMKLDARREQSLPVPMILLSGPSEATIELSSNTT